MIESLTKEQEEKLAVYRDKWLAYGLSTEPADRPRAEQVIVDVYKEGGLKAPPIVVWMDSPWEGVLAATKLEEATNEVISGMGLKSVWDLNSEGARKEASAMVKGKLDVMIKGISKADGKTWENVRSQVQRCGYGSQDASWISYYDYMGEVLGLECCDRLKPLIELSKVSGWWWPYDEACILCERANKLFRDDDGRLHSELGAAIEYPDGWGVYAWHGVRVPSWIILETDKITPEIVMKEDNQEIRRVMLELYGWDKLLEDMEAITIHEDAKGILVSTTKLGEYLEGEDDEARFVLVNDPSTNRRYALRVDPSTKTASEAVASTFGETANSYNPVAES